MKDFFTPKELSQKYPVSRSTIYGACTGGALPHYRVSSKRGGRGKYLIKETDFLVWLESNRHAGGSAPPEPKVKPQTFEHLKL